MAEHEMGDGWLKEACRWKGEERRREGEKEGSLGSSAISFSPQTINRSLVWTSWTSPSPTRPRSPSSLPGTTSNQTAKEKTTISPTPAARPTFPSRSPFPRLLSSVSSSSSANLLSGSVRASLGFRTMSRGRSLKAILPFVHLLSLARALALLPARHPTTSTCSLSSTCVYEARYSLSSRLYTRSRSRRQDPVLRTSSSSCGRPQCDHRQLQVRPYPAPSHIPRMTADQRSPPGLLDLV
jgi:hypothetical protein